MLRTIVGVSFVLALAGAVACSSKSTEDNKGAGGNGSVLGGSNTGGTASTAGSSSASAGKSSSSSGATGTGGAEAGACMDQSITCVDATSAKGCNPDTGVVETFDCVDELGALGIVSTGCTTDATGDFCSIDDFSDQACATGTAAFAYCENATTDEQVFNIYVNCYLDNMDGHTVIPCFSNYVSPTMKTSADCLAAEDACFGGGVPGAGGAGSNGAGGAP